MTIFQINNGEAYYGYVTYIIEADTAQEAIKESGVVAGADSAIDSASAEAYEALGLNTDELDGDALEQAYEACDNWLVEHYGSLEEAYLAHSEELSLSEVELGKLDEHDLLFYCSYSGSGKHRFRRNDAYFDASQHYAALTA
jgi:hypothetical protein